MVVVVGRLVVGWGAGCWQHSTRKESIEGGAERRRPARGCQDGRRGGVRWRRDAVGHNEWRELVVLAQRGLGSARGEGTGDIVCVPEKLHA